MVRTHARPDKKPGLAARSTTTPSGFNHGQFVYTVTFSLPVSGIPLFVDELLRHAPVLAEGKRQGVCTVPLQELLAAHARSPIHQKAGLHRRVKPKDCAQRILDGKEGLLLHHILAPPASNEDASVFIKPGGKYKSLRTSRFALVVARNHLEPGPRFL